MKGKQHNLKKSKHDEEMKIVLKELDRQRDSMNRKMDKLRSVFNVDY